jgi:hypothetical protein
MNSYGSMNWRRGLLRLWLVWLALLARFGWLVCL